MTSFSGRFQLSGATVDAVGNVALSLFLVMALMTMRLLDLVNLAGPLLVILAAQTDLDADRSPGHHDPGAPGGDAVLRRPGAGGPRPRAEEPGLV